MQEMKFLFDFMSPYSCLAWQWLSQQNLLLERTKLYPISMGSLIGHFETKGPAQIPVKRDYLFKAALRAAVLNDLYLEIPAKLPFNSLLIQRLGLAGVSQSRQAEVIDLLFKGVWQLGVDMESPEAVAELLGTKFESSLVQQMMDQTSSKEARLEQRKNQALALESKAFGVPSFVVEQELFWGFDAREDLLRYLNKSDPLNQDKFHQFLALFPLE